MRTIADPYTRVLCMRVIPSYGGMPIRVAQYPMSLKMSNGVTYSPGDGTEFSDFEFSAGFTPAVIEIKGASSSTGFSRERLLRGELDGSRMYLFATSWANPIEDEEPLGTFIFGKADVDDETFNIEAVHILDAFNLDISVTYAKECNNTFCDVTPDYKQVPFSVCGLSYLDYEVTGTLTAVNAVSRTVTDSSRAEAADAFTLGHIQFEFENDAGDTVYTPPFEIRDFASGVFSLLQWPLYTVAIGTAYKARIGCNKKYVTCKDTFNNIANPTGGGFLGFPNTPTDRNG